MPISTVLSWMQLLAELVCFERCRSCNVELRSNSERRLSAVCQSCWIQISGKSPPFQWCRLEAGPCFPISSGTYYTGPVKKLIYRLKYDRDRLLTGDLGLLLNVAWTRLDPYLQDTNPQELLLVPIPLHITRLRERGFNHAALLARQLHSLANIPLTEGAMQRIKLTRPQHGLTRAERMENLNGAFRCRPDLVAGKKVLLIDDIYTSGATLAEAGRTVLSSGAAGVAGLTVARVI